MTLRSWSALLAAAGVPRAQQDEWSGWIAAAVQSPAFGDRMATFSTERAFVAPPALSRRIQEDMAMWQGVVQSSGFKVEG